MFEMNDPGRKRSRRSVGAHYLGGKLTRAERMIKLISDNLALLSLDDRKQATSIMAAWAARGRIGAENLKILRQYGKMIRAELSRR